MCKLEHKRFSSLLTILIITGILFAGCNDKSAPTAAANEPDVTDVSIEATLTVSNENPGGPFAGEGSSKLIDGNKDTKFLTFDYDSDFWMQQDFEETVSINAYTMTSGNDAPDRDPQDWTLLGSDDEGETWETVDTKTDIEFSARNRVYIYRLDSEASYSTFRLAISENAGETTLMQMSEWRLIYYNE